MSKPHNHHPPQWILHFFRWFCHPDFQEDIEGDLLERFETRASEEGIKKAKHALIFDVLKLFRPGLMKSLLSQPQNFYDMHFNHFKIAWRTLLNNRGFAFLNIAGLTLGITCCLLIFSFVNFHKSYDTYHDETDRSI
jgi:putative ABC transport system permease protein